MDPKESVRVSKVIEGDYPTDEELALLDRMTAHTVVIWDVPRSEEIHETYQRIISRTREV